jgi:hypothetical protein
LDQIAGLRAKGEEPQLEITPLELTVGDKMVRSGSTNFANFVADVVRSS